jgi:hypothetical protein
MEKPNNWKDQLTSSLLTVPDTFWTSFFNKIAFNDLEALLDEDSGFRDTLVIILRDDPIYMKQIEKNIILECIEDLEKEADISFWSDLRSFFVEKGFVGLDPTDEKNYPKYKNIVNEYLDRLIDMFQKNEYGDFRQGYIDSEIEKLQKLKTEKRVPFELMESFKYKTVDKFYDFNLVSKIYREKIETLDDIPLNNFINDLFYGKNSYENVKEYLQAIKKALDKKYHPYLLDCIEYRWNHIKQKLKEKTK